MEYFKLNNNLLIPKVGIGTNTFGKEGNEYGNPINYDTKELISAFNNGYRLIDTAIKYRNEEVIGKAIKESLIAREEFFVTSKISTTLEFVKDDETIYNLLNESIKKIGSYIDLFLIHHPSDDNNLNLRVWKILEKYYNKGLLKAIGVSNFKEKELQYILKYGNVKPAVNQIEINPKNLNLKLIKYSLDNKIIPTAWSPLRANSEQIEFLENIGKKYNKSWTQVFLKFLITLNVIVIPKSHNKERQLENISIFDFELTKKEINEIKQQFN